MSRQIMSPVHYCNKKGIVHRELKLENNVPVETSDIMGCLLFKRNPFLQLEEQILWERCDIPSHLSAPIAKHHQSLTDH